MNSKFTQKAGCSSCPAFCVLVSGEYLSADAVDDGVIIAGCKAAAAEVRAGKRLSMWNQLKCPALQAFELEAHRTKIRFLTGKTFFVV
ncbi:hypothetical protein [Geobacter benzoatilyticus]|uniref:DUF1667 domain-containing protein n=1 Tax=Geobacter benzoatilyticus TaxID=2815309 RepID=A0ABX7Q420_9BACT|nr:hypothetical protein [Geobacter benzoatilyticus]QSV45646.1 hypothetical protein JZM60_16275 [Geobacter benzoatilyticus]